MDITINIIFFPSLREYCKNLSENKNWDIKKQIPNFGIHKKRKIIALALLEKTGGKKQF